MRKSIMIAALVVVGLAGCEKSSDQKGAGSAAPSKAPLPGDDHKHEPGDGHQHTETESHGGHGGEIIELGTMKVGAFSVRATRDKGEIKPGGDAPIDVWIDDGVGKNVSVVRFWIGTQDAKGSIKVKADIEDGKWHTHAEVPDPLPADSKLWVEIEAGDGKKATGSFDLNL